MWYVAIGLSLAIAIGYLVKYSSVLRSILGLPDEADDTTTIATQLVTPGNSADAGPETHTANAATQTSIEFTAAPAAAASTPFNPSTDALKPSSSSSSTPSSSTSTSPSSSSATAADRGPPQEPSSDSSSIRTAAAAEKKVAIATEAARMLEKQVDTMAAEVERCKQVIVKTEAENSQLRDRLAEQAKVQLTKGPSNFENLSLGENRPSKLIKRYADLYTDDRIDAWDDLDLLPDDIDDDSKQKLLLSIVVLCFRQAQTSLEGRQRAVRTILLSSSSGGPPTSGTFDGQEDGVQLDDSLVKDIDDCVESSLRRTVNRYNIFDDFKEVTSQLWSKLVDYPSLRDCPSLLRYIEECLRIAWALTIQNPAYVIDYDVADVFSDDRHTRFHASDPESTRIESFLWPALIEKPSGYCASKAVVVTRDP